jgi:hypothetical protein
MTLEEMVHKLNKQKQFPAESLEIRKDCEQLKVKLVRWWRSCDHIPRLGASVRRHWSSLIDEWWADKTMPIFIRRSSVDAPRGTVIKHRSNRKLITSDNSPAWYVCFLAHCGQTPSRTALKQSIAEKQIPVAYVMSKEVRQRVDYGTPLSANLIKLFAPWTVCHKSPIRLGRIPSLAEMDDGNLKTHFRRFLDPSNILLVPKVATRLWDDEEFMSDLTS